MAEGSSDGDENSYRVVSRSQKEKNAKTMLMFTVFILFVPVY